MIRLVGVSLACGLAAATSVLSLDHSWLLALFAYGVAGALGIGYTVLAVNLRLLIPEESGAKPAPSLASVRDKPSSR